MRALAPLALLLVAGCATTSGGPRAGGVEATRFHLGNPQRGTIAADPGAMSLEQSIYRDAVANELRRLGFTPAADSGTSRYVYSVGVTRLPREAARRRSPVTIGVGGSSGGYYGGGVGVGASFGVGGGSRESIVTEMSVQIRERTGGTVWEGRAQTEEATGRGEDLRRTADRLANALFGDFPGESGRTISVR